VRAGQLLVGEYLRSESGPLEIAMIQWLDGTHQVFNLEVAGNHTYLVGADAVLSHNSCETPGPGFVVAPNGTVFPVPKNASGPTPNINRFGKTTGSAFTGGKGGANGQVETMRLMDSNYRYPKGYIKYENKSGQGVNPYSGRTGSPAENHFSLE
jgi:hypothetical protein